MEDFSQNLWSKLLENKGVEKRSREEGKGSGKQPKGDGQPGVCWRARDNAGCEYNHDPSALKAARREIEREINEAKS